MRARRAGHPQHISPENQVRAAVRRVAVRGDLTDDARVLSFNRTCIKSINQRAERLIIDVSDVTRSDTKLIAVLISLYANCRRRRIDLEMHLSPAIIDWLAIYDLSWIVDLCAPAEGV